MKAWIVISPVKPPADWGFKQDRNKTNQRCYRVTTSKLHALQLLADLHNLEIPGVKIKPARFQITP